MNVAKMSKKDVFFDNFGAENWPLAIFALLIAVLKAQIPFPILDIIPSPDFSLLPMLGLKRRG